MEGSGLQKEILFLLFLPLLLIILLQLLGNAYRHLAVLPDFHGKFAFTLGEGAKNRGITEHFRERYFSNNCTHCIILGRADDQPTSLVD